MSGRPPKRTTMPPGASLLDMMASGDGFGSVPLQEIPEPPAGSFGEFLAKLEERGAEFQRLRTLEPDLVRARKMLDGREILSERAEEWQGILGYCMIRYCSLAEDREIDNLAHLVRDTCAAMISPRTAATSKASLVPVPSPVFRNTRKG